MLFVLPLARAVLPFLGKAAASGAIGLGTSSLLGKIFGGKIKIRKRRKYLKKKNKITVYRRRYYRRYVR